MTARPVRRHRRLRRRGNVLVTCAFIIIVMLAMMAMAIDLGYIMKVRAEAQRAADAAAIAATWELVDDNAGAGGTDPGTLIANARTSAGNFVAANQVGSKACDLAIEDVEVGYLANPSDPDEVMTFTDPEKFNAVRVRLRRTDAQNGEVSLFFARAMGFDSAPVAVDSTAAVLASFGGFQAPADGGNLDLLPFALDEVTWNGMLGGTGTDNYCWNAEDQCVENGSDGVLEINLFPQGTGSPGNRGTVDIGSNNNSTADIARQIVEGVSPADLEHHGGKLELDECGKLELNGDTGISAGVKDELASIIGEPRIIPIFRKVEGPGNNAQYTIVKFVGVRIMYVKLTGSMNSKKVMIQPAKMTVRGGIPASSGTSDYIYSPVWLVR